MSETKIVSAREYKNIAISDLPSGKYPGFWGGDEVKIQIGSIRYLLKAEHAIRTPIAHCLVVIENGKATVELD